MSAADTTLHGVFAALDGLQSPGARCVMFMAAWRGEGVSTLARTFAEQCAWRSRRATLLVDLDLLRNSQCQSFIESGIPVAESADGRLAGATFVRAVMRDGVEAPMEARRMRIARVGDQRLYVTHFDAQGLKDDVRLQISNAPEYWRAARAGADYTVVDAPALQRSRAGLGVAAHMDGVVLVVSGAAGSAAATLALKAELERRGARVLGLVYAHADRGVTLLERLFQRRFQNRTQYRAA